MPIEWWLRPVRRQLLVGEHIAVTWKLVYLRPRCASRSMAGVSIDAP